MCYYHTELPETWSCASGFKAQEILQPAFFHGRRAHKPTGYSGWMLNIDLIDMKLQTQGLVSDLSNAMKSKKRNTNGKQGMGWENARDLTRLV